VQNTGSPSTPAIAPPRKKVMLITLDSTSKAQSPQAKVSTGNAATNGVQNANGSPSTAAIEPPRKKVQLITLESKSKVQSPQVKPVITMNPVVSLQKLSVPATTNAPIMTNNDKPLPTTAATSSPGTK